MRQESCTNIACRYLLRVGKPVPIKKVIDCVLSTRQLGGETPRKTVSAAIRRCPRIKNMGGMCSLQ